MTKEIGLTTLDLVSKLTGYFSLGCSIWYAFPQIFLNFVEKPPAKGPSFSLLVLWLIGDIALTTALFFENSLFTQRFSGIWFGATDIVIILQLTFYRGWIPGTQRWHDRKTRTLLLRHDERAAVQAARQGGFRGRVRRLLGSPWLNFIGDRLNGILFVFIFLASLVAWLLIDFLPRESATRPKPTNPPHDAASWGGWTAGWLGLLFYQVPRAYQVYKIVRNGMESISVWLFAYLVGQNATLIVSILTINHARHSLFGQAPFIANTLLALGFDLTVLQLNRKYSKVPHDAAYDIERPPSQAGPPAVISVAERSEELAEEASASTSNRSRPSLSSLASRRASTSSSHSQRRGKRPSGRGSRTSLASGRSAGRSSGQREGSSSSDGEDHGPMEHSPEELEWARIQPRLGRSASRSSCRPSHPASRTVSSDFSDRALSLEKRDRRRLPFADLSESDEFSEPGGDASSSEDQHVPLHARGHPLGTHPHNPRRGVGTRWA
ncbi:hypothetical protein JCM11251_006440 [Rhodosporidiobolus azoricus]